ncbi:glutamyl aminopeptidase-like isoform X2 [Ostrinia furnacalis]|uniref:glutamyl aminopeptidase-like isoform X2 n=1 Tax=Ostrinia furnacalis TaxID=93504 RepID=UPI00103FC5D0|nr:glutamyl aminopeptidase-like isoform X2 [Ostrinia furnacalis]
MSKFLQWTNDNKLVIFLLITTVCFLVSTVVLSSRIKHASACPLEGSPYTQKNFNNERKEDDLVSNKSAYYRLPRHTIPRSYKLLLQPDMTNKTFHGVVEISLQVTNPTKSITLHSNKLNITTTSLTKKRKDKISIDAIHIVPGKREFLVVNLQDEIQKGSYALKIEFSGRLDKGFIGFYSSTLKNGKTMVASKFQPTYARQAFPCFDEPDFKATYDISLVKPKSYIALSNMNEISKSPTEDGKSELVTFATSVPMSTYLACFVVCDFDYKENEINANGIGKNFILRSFAQKNQMHKIDFAQDIGRRATEFYVKYYEVPFPLPKLDMIAIPDYVSGATEHWGLITYRETSFLVDDSTASSKNKISVANTIAHELAHMWFGNLVTMKWWDDLWLNEGFASYMQVKALNAIEPSWTMLDQFLTKTLHSVLVTDAKLSSHPIVQTVSTPDQITAIFDAISYNKGSSVLRMLEGFIGEENFRKGVSDYLQKYKFGNTVTQDLLSSLEPYSKQEHPELDINYVMDTWTKQMGYPLVTVSRGEKPNTYVLTQRRFLLDPEAVYPNDSEFDYRWFIPITYTTNKGPKKDILWFPNGVQKVDMILEADENWVKINNNQVGYYRVNYTLDMWKSLIEQLKLKAEQLTISDRSNLLDDVFALAETKTVPYRLALDLTGYLSVEEDYVPWETASAVFSRLADKLMGTVVHDKLQKYIQKLVSPLYTKQSWERSKIGVIEGLLRTRILSLATRCRLPEAEDKVRALFLDWLNNHGTDKASTIEPDLRDFVYYYGMKSSSQAEWDKLWQIYLKEEDAQEQTKLRNALAGPRDPELLKKYLYLSWDEKNIRSQDFLNVLHYISSNPSGTALVWDEVRSRWPELVDRFTLNSRYLGNLIPGITSSFNSQLRLKEMEAFFEQYPEAGAGEAARRRALETVKGNIKWAASHQAAVAAWLEQHVA